MGKSLVSAIILTHNRLFYLKKALKSVYNQTYKNMEIIIVDDNSNDGTQKYCENLNNVKYIRISEKESKGGNYARNIGVKASSGKYIALLDDDDEWLPDKIKKQVEFLENNDKYGMVYCKRWYVINESGYKYVENINNKNFGDCSKKILYNMMGTTSTYLFKSSILKKCLFDENLRYWQDYELMIRIAQITQIGFIDNPLILYNHNLLDKKRLTNNLDGWKECVQYINEKHSEIISKLNVKEKKLRQKMIYIDAIVRYGIIGDKRNLRKYLLKNFILSKSVKDFMKFILNYNPVKKIQNKAKKMINTDETNQSAYVQVNKEHYNFFQYVNSHRWNSYYYQIVETLKCKGKEVLIIGIGDGIVVDILKKFKDKNITTFDFDKSLNPDILGSVTEIDMVLKKKYDIILCCQVLEHIPFDMFEKTIVKISKSVNEKFILSLPNCDYWFRLALITHNGFNINILRCIRRLFKSEWSINKQGKGEHYWEIDAKGYSKRKVNRIIKKYFIIERFFVPQENTYHMFYILKN